MESNIKNRPLVSIIIPVYNGQETIKRAIESVQKQTYSDFEILVIDNGSVDNTVSLVNKLIELDDRIKLLHSIRGRSIARNKGLNYSNGEYINFLDADDQFTQEHLERAVTFLNNHLEYYAYSEGATYLDIEGNTVISKTKNHDIKNLEYRNIFEISSILFRRSSDICPFNEKLSHNEDWLFWAQNLANKKIFQNNTLIGQIIHITGKNTMSDINNMIGSEVVVLSSLDSSVNCTRRAGLIVMFLNSDYVHEKKMINLVKKRFTYTYLIINLLFKVHFINKVISYVALRKVKVIQKNGIY
ncbi:glycosyltransferase family 2 protein [Leuconostoc citreum]|uniref:glycosyltransferase family 2 protein n=1 Tax=Leuconostoc citreum TaxID=33964 RepID=UPI0015F3F8CE|nr:glycosyltransferase [Leuconostoc citreum]MBA5938421.1 glycosyltransferase [Leuconostoc citreum]